MIRRLLLASVLAIAATSAEAHLMQEGNATMKIAENSAFLVVSVPASALTEVDDDGDGAISPLELEKHKDAVEQQFRDGFSISDGANSQTRSLIWISAPHTDHQSSNPKGMDYLVVMNRVDFAIPPKKPKVTFRLFGEGPQHDHLTLKASHGELTETAVLTSSLLDHTFFTAE
ncbi:MAG: hypothetical protein GW854_10070 [Erythrobacter sp.]|nr:hypothetical protein [Erythrobacter sp.]